MITKQTNKVPPPPQRLRLFEIFLVLAVGAVGVAEAQAQRNATRPVTDPSEGAPTIDFVCVCEESRLLCAFCNSFFSSFFRKKVNFYLKYKIFI